MREGVNHARERRPGTEGRLPLAAVPSKRPPTAAKLPGGPPLTSLRL